MNTRREIPYLQAAMFYFCLLYKHTNDSLDDFPTISEHFPKICFPNPTSPPSLIKNERSLVWRPDKRFRTFSEHFWRLPKICEDNRRFPRKIRWCFDHKATHLSTGIYYVTIAMAIFSLVKITCYCHVKRDHVYARKFTWYFTGVYIIMMRNITSHTQFFPCESNDLSRKDTRVFDTSSHSELKLKRVLSAIKWEKPLK